MSKHPLRVLFVTAEMSPLAKTGGLGDVSGALPLALRDAGLDVRVILPLYRQVRRRMGDQLREIGRRQIRMGWRSVYCGILTAEVGGVPCYFVDNEFYYDHDDIYIEYSFDLERFAYFQRAVLASLGDGLGFSPDILHANDWQTGMIPVLLDAHYRPNGYWRSLRTVYTIHNLKYQGVQSVEMAADMLDLPQRYLNEDCVLHDGVVNYMKAGIRFADRVTTVSPSYADEIQDDFYGEGLAGLLRANSFKLSGILNGIDTDSYQPAVDEALPVRYSVADWKQGKAACRAALEQEIGLPVNKSVPLVMMITRLVEQKGIDLLIRVLDEMMSAGRLQLAILGTGQERYEQELKAAAARYPDSMAVCLRFDEALSRRMYAAADMFLMPSLFEPCGLSQMIAMRYGALPIVRETGGLKDTVRAYNQFTGEGNGFSFTNINAHELLWTTWAACDLWRDNPKAWAGLVSTAMKGDYSWARSARLYDQIYRTALGETGA